MINRSFLAHTVKRCHMELLEKRIDRPVAEARERLFEGLYERAFPLFARIAAQRNASFEDARDIFHDALVVYYEKCGEPEFVIQVSPEAYVLGIAKHLWIKRFNRDRHHVSLTEYESSISLPLDHFAGVNEDRLLSFLERSGRKCLELLRQFYYEKTSLGNIAASLGYRSEHSVAVQKFKCIGKIRDAIRSKAMNYEDFLV